MLLHSDLFTFMYARIRTFTASQGKPTCTCGHFRTNKMQVFLLFVSIPFFCIAVFHSHA